MYCSNITTGATVVTADAPKISDTLFNPIAIKRGRFFPPRTTDTQ